MMTDRDDFNAMCNDFYKQYATAKKNLSGVEKLVKSQIIPIEKSFVSGVSTECREGCSHCCQLRVVAFPHELIAIYLYINRTFSSEEVKGIKGKITTQFEQIKKLTQDEHFTINVECPLLEKNKCSVYPVRPLACAGYHSMSEAACKESNDNPHIVGNENGGIPMVIDIKLTQELQVHAAAEVMRSLGDDTERYELIRGLYTIFHNPSVNQRWISGRKFQK